MERRIRDDHPNFELRRARVFRARKEFVCAWCSASWFNGLTFVEKDMPIHKGETYARISETRLPVCQQHFTADDIVEVDRAP